LSFVAFVSVLLTLVLCSCFAIAGYAVTPNANVTTNAGIIFETFMLFSFFAAQFGGGEESSNYAILKIKYIVALTVSR
jgi:hypothetical protein